MGEYYFTLLHPKILLLLLCQVKSLEGEKKKSVSKLIIFPLTTKCPVTVVTIQMQIFHHQCHRRLPMLFKCTINSNIGLYLNHRSLSTLVILILGEQMLIQLHLIHVIHRQLLYLHHALLLPVQISIKFVKFHQLLLSNNLHLLSMKKNMKCSMKILTLTSMI